MFVNYRGFLFEFLEVKESLPWAASGEFCGGPRQVKDKILFQRYSVLFLKSVSLRQCVFMAVLNPYKTMTVTFFFLSEASLVLRQILAVIFIASFI